MMNTDKSADNRYQEEKRIPTEISGLDDVLNGAFPRTICPHWSCPAIGGKFWQRDNCLPAAIALHSCCTTAVPALLSVSRPST